MKLKVFKQEYKKFSKLPLPKEIWNTPEYELYINALHENKKCTLWYKKQKIKEAGLNIEKHCCLDMAYHLIEDSTSISESPINYDSVITHKTKSGDYGLPIHDGGSSYIKIKYCPWCAKKL
jgi:hypothetical protein